MLFPDITTIKSKRISLGMTQKQLASHSGISQSLIAKLESKKVSPSYDIVKRIFDTFDEIEHQKEEACHKLINKNRKMISINSKDTVRHAAEIMRKNAVSQLPVFENKRLVGNISETTIYNKMLEKNKNQLFSLKVKEIMEDPLPTIAASTPKSVAMPLLKTNSAILLTEKDKIIGILTKEDFIVKS